MIYTFRQTEQVHAMYTSGSSRLRGGVTKTGGIGSVRILKPSNLLFTVSKFQKKIKVSKKYVKKTRSNFKVTSGEIFIKPSRLDW
jgi:hypothetical protein